MLYCRPMTERKEGSKPKSLFQKVLNNVLPSRRRELERERRIRRIVSSEVNYDQLEEWEKPYADAIRGAVNEFVAQCMELTESQHEEDHMRNT